MLEKAALFHEDAAKEPKLVEEARQIVLAKARASRDIWFLEPMTSEPYISQRRDLRAIIRKETPRNLQQWTDRSDSLYREVRKMMFRVNENSVSYGKYSVLEGRSENMESYALASAMYSLEGEYEDSGGAAALMAAWNVSQSHKCLLREGMAGEAARDKHLLWEGEIEKGLN